MSANRSNAQVNRLGVPAVLMSLCLLALIVSLFGLFRTSGLTQTRVDELQASWQELMNDGVEGSEIVATDRLMQSVSRPVPAVHSAAQWSFAMGVLSLVLFVWIMMTLRSIQRSQQSADIQQAQNDQAAMAKLLDEMAPLASGDLAVRATMHDGASGALADAFNHAVSELQRLAEIQLSTSRALGESVNQSHELATVIEQQCSQQSGHIHQSSNSLLGMSSSTGALSANAADTAVAAKSVLDKTDKVTTDLNTISKQLDGVRRDTDLAISLMHSLKQHTHSIEDGIALLEDLTRRTDLLAVNTTIRVSSAKSDATCGDVSRLTDEVARLAEALGQTHTDITTSMRSMSADTSEAATCMQRLHDSYDAQTAKTRSITHSLVHIRSQSQAMHKHSVNMAEQAVLYAGVVKELSENLNLINQITEQTGQDARTNAQSVEGLKKLANDLRQSTSDFSLPDKHSTKPDNQEVISISRHAAGRAVING